MLNLTSSDVLSLYSEHVNPTLAKLLKLSGYALVEEHAEGVFIYAGGRRLLDLLACYGALVLGHRHPKVVEAVKRQLELLPLSTKVLLNEQMANLAKRLAELSGLKYVFFSNSGAEAVEAALKLARLATGKLTIISTWNSYHGKTLGALSVTGRDIYRKGLESIMPGTVFVEYGNLEAVEQILRTRDDIAGIIVEPVQGEGGVNVPPEGYLKGLRELTAKYGVLLIIDEVQTGMGRLGKMFAYQLEDIVPDILILAKGLGGGVVPIGATLGTERVWKPLIEYPTYHTSTFGGNPLACSAGLATIETLIGESIIDGVPRKSELLMRGLRELWERYPELIADLRGKGLLIGLEMRDTGIAGAVFYGLIRRGVLTAYTLNQPKVIRIEPPLIIEEGHIRDALDALELTLKEVASNVRSNRD